MNQAAPIYDGWLILAGARVPIKARYASRYSLWVELDSSPEASEVESCTLCVEDKQFEIGPCRLLRDVDGEMPRLVPVIRIHDFEKLFFHSKVDTLESASLNLSLVLG